MRVKPSQDPLVLAASALAGALVLGGTLAYMHSSPERLKRFREGGERVARQSAEAKRQRDLDRRLRQLHEEYFSTGAGADILAKRAFDIAPVGRPFADAVRYSPSLNAYSYGEGFLSRDQDAQFEYSYDGHDAVGRWQLDIRDQRIGGGIAKPEARLTIYCPQGQGLLEPAERCAIRRLLGTPTSRIAEVRFVRSDFRAIEEEIWQQHLAQMGEQGASA
ncbi:hypothetical protein [Novosphingobium sp. Gsoil 351]|uniref:hypothetical protein n=1 Tax=Novosphingobium sp. Gsoil 351 TaxID=2675225 RepID=UPI0012B49BF0|nr:hypothetical protein [Novosphingobium sp. Gsoil 351]QGN55794.1 hypothetical protein GKE62_15810 [Novosphingobium sp. Gsoil 351]